MSLRRAPVFIALGYVLLGWASSGSAQTLSAGAAHSVVVTRAGTVWSFGQNTDGQLGDGTTTQRTTPAIVSSLANIVAVAAGGEHTLALESDGTVWAWGRNSNGQLGDGTTTGRTAPVVVAGLPPITAIAAGAQHSIALASDGTVWTWGLNSNGQLGDGTTTRSLQPIVVTTGWAATGIAAGHSDWFLPVNSLAEQHVRLHDVEMPSRQAGLEGRVHEDELFE